MARERDLPTGVSVYKRRKDQGNRGKPYWIAYHDHKGKRRYVRGFTDREATVAKAWKLHKEAERRAAGLVTDQEVHALAPIQQHLKAFIDSRRTRKRSTAYINQLETRIRFIVDGLSIRRVIDLDPVAVEMFLNKVEEGYTRNEYITSIRTFTRWLVRQHRCERDPLSGLEKIEIDRIKRRHQRRALSADEVQRLLRSTTGRPLAEAMTIRRGENKGKMAAKVRDAVKRRLLLVGQRRKLAYQVIVWTGLRRSEAASLRWGDVHLDCDIPHLLLRAETTKSRRADVVALHSDVVVALRDERNASVKDDDPVLLEIPSPRVLKADLAYAGISHVTEHNGQNQYVDLHALRMTLDTMMAAHGISQRVRQAHLRHADPRLTDTAYIDEKLLPVAEQITALPSIAVHKQAEIPSEPEPAEGGTEVVSSAQQNAQQTGGETGQDVALPDDDGILITGYVGDTCELVKMLEASIDQGITGKKINPAESSTGPTSKAGERIRTVDIHVGNVIINGG